MRLRVLLTLLAALALVIAACADGEEEADPEVDPDPDPAETEEEPEPDEEPDEEAEEEADDGELTSISYATSFGQFGRDSYVYMAIENGYFEEAGLDVSVTPGQGSADNARLIASGQLDFAPLDFSALVVTRANEDVPVRGVSTVHQQWLSAIIAREDSGISEPADLEGATLADAPGSVVRIMFPVYAERAGIDADSIEWVNADPPQLPGLLAAGQVDAVGQFVVGEPLFANVTEGPVNVLPYAEEIPELPGIVIAASDDTIEERPDVVRAFIEALNRGLEDALADPERAAEILLEYAPEAEATVAAAELEVMRDFVITDFTQANGVGAIEEGRLEEAVAITAAGYDLEREIDADEVYATGFVGD